MIIFICDFLNKIYLNIQSCTRLGDSLQEPLPTQRLVVYVADRHDQRVPKASGVESSRRVRQRLSACPARRTTSRHDGGRNGRRCRTFDVYPTCRCFDVPDAGSSLRRTSSPERFVVVSRRHDDSTNYVTSAPTAAILDL